MKKFNLVALSTIMIALTGCASSRYYNEKTYVTGTVIVSHEAAKKCFRKKENNDGSVFVGTVVGGIVGNKFGGGKGKIATTALGAIVGGVAADAINDKEKGNYDCYSDGYLTQVQFKHPETLEDTTYILKTNNRLHHNEKISFEYQYKVDKEKY